MRHVGTTRSDHLDLLTRLPLTADTFEGRFAVSMVDPVEQLKELEDLVDRGLLSTEEFERQRRKMFEP